MALLVSDPPTEQEAAGERDAVGDHDPCETLIAVPQNALLVLAGLVLVAACSDSSDPAAESAPAATSTAPVTSLAAQKSAAATSTAPSDSDLEAALAAVDASGIDAVVASSRGGGPIAVSEFGSFRDDAIAPEDVLVDIVPSRRSR